MSIDINFILDQDRRLYKFFNLRSSIQSTWSLNSIRHYANMKRKNVSLPKYIQNDDIYQMGGDVQVKNGRILQVFRSEHALDRPIVGHLLKF